jgi:hypothetical protein
MTNQTFSSHRPRWPIAALGVAIGITVAGVALFSTALAVHDDPGTPFELDGNATNAAGTYNPLVGPDFRDDWQNVFNLPTNGNVGNPVFGSGETFIRDMPADSPANATERQYNLGKDSLDVTTWTTKAVGTVVPDKDNIVNAFAKQYNVDLDGGGPQGVHKVIYFGADRFANNGDAALGFWFFQHGVETSGDGFTMASAHTARNDATGQRGDILVQVDFVSGGSSSEIQIFEWLGNNAPPAGTPSNKLFGGGTLLELGAGASNGSGVCMAGDVACAITNNDDSAAYHWRFESKFPVVIGKGKGTIQQKYPHESFYEGGIDVTALLGDVCFNSFLANTRTSHSETADLKDLALGDFNTCGSIAMTKDCRADSGYGTPSYDDSLLAYKTTHRVTIENDGEGGPIFDIQMRDDAVGGAHSCDIVKVGNTPVAPISLPAFDPNDAEAGWVDVPGGESLDQSAGGTVQLVVTLLCVSPENPFDNTATVRAAQNNNGPRTLMASDDETDTGDLTECPVNVPTGLALTKGCPTPVVWEVVGGVYKPKVCVTIGIQNTGQASIVMSEFKDHRNDGSVADLISEIPLVSGQRRLTPGQAITGIVDCYNPTAPDIGTGQTDPDYSTYSDQVRATGAAVTAPAVPIVADPQNASCPLCPGRTQ